MFPGLRAKYLFQFFLELLLLAHVAGPWSFTIMLPGGKNPGPIQDNKAIRCDPFQVFRPHSGQGDGSCRPQGFGGYLLDSVASRRQAARSPCMEPLRTITLEAAVRPASARPKSDFQVDKGNDTPADIDDASDKGGNAGKRVTSTTGLTCAIQPAPARTSPTPGGTAEPPAGLHGSPASLAARGKGPGAIRRTSLMLDPFR